MATWTRASRKGPRRGDGSPSVPAKILDILAYLRMEIMGMSLKQEALAALRELPSHRQTIGKLGAQLRRCKPGTKRYREIWDALTRLENDACEMSSTIRTALLRVPDKET